DIGAYEASFLGDADLSVILTAQPNPVEPGGVLTYTVVVLNAGPGATGSVQVQFTPPPGSTNLQTSGAGWDCIIAGSVTCVRGALAASGVAPAITISLRVPSPGGVSTATATVSSPQRDPVLTNNTATLAVFRGRPYLWIPLVTRQ
ncbi:MAG: DUF11 domain-containing protein, partial [Roseiflexus sp.]|nr:DUF11 domain-containing protein [Roseiflexus sp.]